MKAWGLPLLLLPAAVSAQQASTAAAVGRAVTLPEAFAAALKNSEELAQRGEGVAGLQARVDELWSAVKPKVGLAGSETIQDVPPPASGAGSLFSQRNREQAQLTLHQPLFAGLREYLAARAAKIQTEASELELERARQLLYEDVARSYYSLAGVRKEISVREALVEIMDGRIRDLRSREKLGRSRKSEVLASEAQHAGVLAQLETSRGGHRVAQLQLRFLTGLGEDLAPGDVTVPDAAPALAPYLDQGARRPDVESARRALAALAFGTTIAGRQRWPALALDGNYYLHRPPGFQDKTRWDVLLSAQIPLYSGGAVDAQVRQAEAARRTQELAAALALRRAQLEVRSAFSDLGSALGIVKALENAAALAEANAAAQAADYRLGLVTNLDVLGSLNSLQEIRLQLEKSRIQAAFSVVRLEVAAGVPGGLR